MSPQAYPAPSAPVLIDLFNDGKERQLRYSIKSIKRIRRTLGRSVMGAGGALMEIDEESLGLLLHEGLRHSPLEVGAVCDCGFHGEDGIEPDVSVDQIENLPSSSYAYLLQKFSEAYLSAQAKKKPETPNLPPAAENPSKTPSSAGG